MKKKTHVGMIHRAETQCVAISTMEMALVVLVQYIHPRYATSTTERVESDNTLSLESS